MKKIILIVVCLCLFANGAIALTWQQSLDLSADNSNEIKSAQNQLESFKWNYYKSYSTFLPQLSANAGTGTNSASYGLSVSQNIFQGMSEYYNVESANANYQYYLSNLINTQANFFYDSRLAFLNLYVAQQNTIVQKTIFAYRSENARMIKLFYDSGKEDKGNYLRAQAQINEAKNNVSIAMRDEYLARFRLSQILETDVTTVEGKNEVIVPENIYYDSLIKNSPTYIMAKYTLDIAEIADKASVSEFLPDISLNGSYQRSGNSWPPTTSDKSISLNLSYSFFPGGSNIADFKINKYNFEKAKQDFAKTKRDLLYSLKNAYTSLRDAIDSFNTQRVYLSASQERAKISQAKYLNGLMSYNEWDIAQNDYINYQKSMISYGKLALQAEASWYKSYGGWIK